jgi:thiol-disulfide isomerase/thioredoxin
MRVLILLILLALPLSMSLAGCDRAKDAPDQELAQSSGAKPAVTIAPKATPPVPSGPKTPVAAERIIKSSGGMEAMLSTKFAGSAAPAASFTGADGRDVTLADFAGRPLLVNIWATWCAPCKAEMPLIDKLASDQAGRISVIAISQDLEGRAPVRTFFDEAGIKNLEPYIDRDIGISTALGTNIALPITILYDSDGKEVWRVTGAVEWSEPAILPLLAEAS